MKKVHITQVAEQVVNDFALEVSEIPQSEEELLDMLGDVVAYLIEKRLEYFMQILYSMDVDEDIMRYAFSEEHNEPVNMVLARAILDRQKKKAQTKMEYKPEVPPDWFDLEQDGICTDNSGTINCLPLEE